MTALLLPLIIGAPFVNAATSSRAPRNFTNNDTESSSNYRLPSSVQRNISRLGGSTVDEFPIPVLFNVTPAQVTDTWGEARSEGRTHEGTDIFAPRGTPVVSPTKSIVASIGQGTLGGNYVYTANPGGERYYFAHLDAYAEGLKVGQTLDVGDVIGYVGNTGNAAGGPTHLHFGIYKHGATNPFERLTEEFTLKERMASVKDMLGKADHEDELADQLVRVARPYFIQAQAQGIDIPKAIEESLIRNPATTITTAGGASGLDLDLGSSGDRVTLLQAFLIKENAGPAAAALAKASATGYFGALTKAALAEYQATHGITPAAGYFGPKTQAVVSAAGARV